MHRNDLAGRIIGIVVCLAGVALLAVVFFVAFSFFGSETAGLQVAKKGTESVASQLGRSVVILVARIAFLIIMTIAASLMAGRGVSLYFASVDRVENLPSGNQKQSE